MTGCTPKRKALINMIGVIAFILPIALLVGSVQLTMLLKHLCHMRGGDPGGLSNRWIVKALIPLSFLLLIISSIGFFSLKT